jgi:hypothetical protein
LTAAEVARLENAFRPGAVSGERYPESAMRNLDK